MDGRLPQLAEQLLLIERELRLLGWWASGAPAPERLTSREPFCVDTLAFEEWLQWILLPRMKVLIEQAGPLPTACALRPMGEMSWGGDARVSSLLDLLGEIDRLLTAAA